MNKLDAPKGLEDLAALLDKLGIKMETRPTTCDNADWPSGSDHQKCIFTRKMRAMEAIYSRGPGHGKPRYGWDRKNLVFPQLHPAEVMWALCQDVSGAGQLFEEWAAGYGYDTDSRKAYATWEAIEHTNRKMRHLLGSNFDAVVECAANADY